MTGLTCCTSVASGTVTTLYNNEDEFHAKYLKRFPGYYHTGDTGHIDEDGYVYVGVLPVTAASLEAELTPPAA